MVMLEIASAGLSDIGRRRQSNQDHFLMDDNHPLYMVADGMGGHQAGEVAAQLVVESVLQYLSASSAADSGDGTLQHDISLSPDANRLREAIQYANQQVYQASTANEKYKGMGSTLAAVQFADNMFIAANVGDSPIYLIHEKTIETLSVPHTLLAEQINMRPDEETVFGPEMQHLLTRGMGVEETVQPDIFESPCFSGDRLVVCSDGLSGKISPAEIFEVVLSKRLPDACQALIDMANERGGDDNITVIVLHVIRQNKLLQRLMRWISRYTGGGLSEG